MLPSIVHFFSLILGAVYLWYVVQRWHLAAADDRVIGFVLNPLLWLSLFGLVYLVLGPFMSEQSQLIFGLYASDAARFKAGLLANYAFLVLFIGYSALPDRRLRIVEPDFGSAGTLIAMGSVVAMLVLWFAVLKDGPALLSLRDQRVAAHDFYKEVFLGKYKFAMLYQLLMIAMIGGALRVRSNYICYGIVAFCSLPIVLIDLYQGGRGMVIGTAILLGIIFGIREKTVPWRAGFILVLWFNIHIMLIRFNATDFKSLAFFYNSISEVYLTHFAFEHIVERDLVSSMSDLGIFMLSKIIPFGLGTGLASQVVQQGTIIQTNLGIGFGLAGNIAAEAYFYGGLIFAFISPWLICMIYRSLYLSRFMLTFPGLIFVVFLNTAAQNIMRTNFYGTFANTISILISYLVFITILTWGYRVLADVGEAAEGSEP